MGRMKKEDKELLLNDLHARLRYQVKGLHRGQVRTLVNLGLGGCYRVDGYEAWFDLDSNQFKPYLRPLSSLTEEEVEELNDTLPGIDVFDHCNPIEFWIDSESFKEISAILDWLNAHHFDYRGLIEMGLALEAPEGMYHGI